MRCAPWTVPPPTKTADRGRRTAVQQPFFRGPLTAVLSISDIADLNQTEIRLKLRNQKINCANRPAGCGGRAASEDSWPPVVRSLSLAPRGQQRVARRPPAGPNKNDARGTPLTACERPFGPRAPRPPRLWRHLSSTISWVSQGSGRRPIPARRRTPHRRFRFLERKPLFNP